MKKTMFYKLLSLSFIAAIIMSCSPKPEATEVSASAATVSVQSLYISSSNKGRIHKSYRFNRRLHARFTRKS